MGLKKTISKAFAGDLIFSILGLVAMNGVIQLFMYPAMEKRMGTAAFGDVITLLAVVSVLATTFGTGASYSRMVSRTKGHDTNGDYNIFLLGTSVLSVIVACIAAKVILNDVSVLFLIAFSALTVLNILRYYGDVEYRLTVNYRRFFVYYLLISVGYAAGTLVYPYVTGSWIFAVALGEALCIVYVCVSGSIFRGKGLLKPSEHFSENTKSMWVLSGTNLINALVLHSDKLLLNVFVNSEAVTVFYVATLIGKIIALLTTPLNGVIIGYLTRYKGVFTKKFFSVVNLVAVGVGVVFTFGGLLVSHIFVYIMYPAVYSLAAPYFLIANAGQVLYFISGSLMVVVLRFIDEKYQLIINMIYAAVFAAAVIPAVIFFGLDGIAWGLVGVNAFRFILIIVFGYIGAARAEKNAERKKE